MILISNVRLPLDHSQDELRKAAAEKLQISREEEFSVSVYKRSVDARRTGNILLVYSLLVEVRNQSEILARKQRDQEVRKAPETSYSPGIVQKTPEDIPRPLIVGTGPAGLFAGIILAEAGLRPILLERGKEVRERAQDTFAFWRTGELKPESNAQFGEGGAGTFSDGKLNTRIKDKANRDRKVLKEFVEAGAPGEILYLNKPHIGTMRLVKILQNIREKIENLGGEYRFQSLVVDVIVDEGKLAGVVLESGEQLVSSKVIFAIGHSARDTFHMLAERGISMEPKPFSIGLRIEHPQEMIDRNQYGSQAGHPRLGAADYQLVYHGDRGRSVYSFCMCPGGKVIAASSETGMVVTNGMSQHARSAVNANSAIVCEVTPTDFSGGPLAGIEFQRCWEKRAFEVGGRTYHAPVQLIGDFLAGRSSSGIGSIKPSYQPGVLPADLNRCLPDYVVRAIRDALPVFEHKIKGFSQPEAVFTGVETRTSSPVRILRGSDYQSVSLAGFYPAGEGAGYAGGILSSAVDGIKAAEAIARSLLGE